MDAPFQLTDEVIGTINQVFGPDYLKRIATAPMAVTIKINRL